MVSSESTIQFVPRITSFNGVDVATKADGDAPVFETAIYTAYLLIFDNNGNRVYFASVDEDNGSWSQKVTMTNIPSGTACFIANVPQTFAEGIATITDLNSSVLTLTYATYSEAGGYLGVPKLNVNGESKLCIPMFGSQIVSNLTNGGNFEIPVKRLFAKVSMNIKMQLTNIGIGQIVPSTVNYELGQYQLYNLPTKVRLMEDNSECNWVDDKSSFYANATTPLSSASNLRLQTININDSDNNAENNSGAVTGIEFYLYVPEYYLMPKSNPTADQKYKPENYDKAKNAIYVELVGEVNQSLIDNTTMHHKIFLGENNTDNYTLKRNKNYLNQVTIHGIEHNDKGTGVNLDHRVSTELINNPVAQAGKAANCYIIAKPGKYTIPAYKGAYNNLNSAILCMADKNISEYDTRVEILANVVEYESITSISFPTLPTYDPETNTISFTVNKMLADNWVPNGSVIMALQYRKKGTTTWTTEWSWHLWFVYNITSAEDGWGTIGYQTMPDGTTNMMDRNLGVHAFTSAGTKAGFYYKYGEHAPYLDPDGDEVYTQYGGGRVGESTPTWNVSGKSVTDPCPPGYKMPSSDVWYSSKQSNMDFGNTYFTYRPAVSLSGVSLQPIYYPYSEYLNGFSVQPSRKAFLAANHPITYKDPLTLRDEDNTSLDSEGTQYELTCDVYYTYNTGAVWSNDNSSLYFQNNGSRTIKYVSGRKREKKNVGKWYSPKYQWQEWKDLTASEMESLSNGLMATIISRFLNDYKVPDDIYKNDYTGYNSYGLPVRCVKEK